MNDRATAWIAAHATDDPGLQRVRKEAAGLLGVEKGCERLRRLRDEAAEPLVRSGT